MEHKEHFHGSDLEKIEKIYGIKKEELVSFSANVNPLGLSPLVKKELSQNLDCLTAYPDREYSDLRKAISSYVNSIPENICVGNGASELISLLSKVCKPKKALILGPTYSEYEHSLGLAGGMCDYFELKETDNFVLDKENLIKSLKAGYDLCVLCNPNNPTSALIEKDVLKEICESVKENNVLLMVDETYMEFVDDKKDASAVSLTFDYKNLIVLRGVSKFFASPGLRLGYAVTSNTDLIKRVNELQVPWSVNSLAEVAGKVMFSDKEYIKNTKEYVSIERERIFERLSKIKSLKVYKPTCNFILCKIISGNVEANDLFDAAIKEKCMIRDCADFNFLDESFFRFCFMKKDDNDRLLNVIEKLFK